MSEELVDVAVIGGGLGGIYAAHRFTGMGLSVVGFDGGSKFGGVWYHNAYPGSRVDTDSLDYCYHFSTEIYSKWRWEERYAPQPDLLEYLNYVADVCDVRKYFRFNTWLRSAKWSSVDDRWHLVTDREDRISCRYLVMCTGQLTEPRPITFPGLDRFEGESVRASRWPEREISFDGRRIGFVGTGSTGVQAIPVLARAAEQLFVFQRTPHYSVPARNRPTELGLQDAIAGNLDAERESYYTKPSPPRGLEPPRKVAEFTSKELESKLEHQWEFGGHGMSYLFSDQAVNRDSNDVVAEFVRNKIRETVNDPVVAEKLCPSYPIGTHRLGLDMGLYESFNRDNVELVDMREAPIVEITKSGVRAADGAEYEVDLLILALGFKAFSGALDAAGVQTEKGQLTSEVWARGPRTLLGLLTPGFPNMFTPTGPGSPSVLSRLFLQNEFHIDWIADCIEHMQRNGQHVIEATEAGADAWGEVVASYAEKLLRRQEDNYMVHVNADDGSRIFQPFPGGMHEYAPRARAIAAAGYEGATFR